MQDLKSQILTAIAPIDPETKPPRFMTRRYNAEVIFTIAEGKEKPSDAANTPHAVWPESRRVQLSSPRSRLV